MSYEYKVVPFIGHSTGRLSAAEVAEQLELAITTQAARGWEFYQLCDVNIEIQPGCIAGLFGAKMQYVRLDQLIFRADRSSATPPPALPDTRHATPPVPRESRNRAEAQGSTDVRARPTLTVTPKHVEMWRQKSDEEVRRAAESLQEYTEEGRQVILAELARRSIELTDASQDEGDVASSSFCYHCGSDVSVGASICGTCGKGL
jgi:hypothetical protein